MNENLNFLSIIEIGEKNHLKAIDYLLYLQFSNWKVFLFSFAASKAAIAASEEDDKLQKLEGQVEHYKVVLAETVSYYF